LISATFTHDSNWTVSFKNAANEVVKTYTGTGTTLSQAWDGKDGTGSVVPDGVYTYLIDAVSSETTVTAPQGTGSVTVDLTPPAAEISSPGSNAVIWSIVTITGTATDANLDTYRVEYGPASGSGPWTLISTATTSVSSGTLAAWDTNDQFNPVPDNDFALRLVSTDKAGNSAIHAIPVTVDNLHLTDVQATAHQIDALAPEPSTISFTINKAATVTLRVISEGTGTLQFQTSQAYPAAGTYSFIWDGKNNAGMVVPDDAYLYVLEASNGVQTSTYSPSAPSGQGTVTCSQAPSFDPVRNEPLVITYNPAQPSRINITVNWSTHTSNVLNAYAVDAGGTFAWNGMNLDNHLYYYNATSTCSVASLLPENYIITSNNAPKVIDLKTDPYTIHLSFGQGTIIKYSLTRDANVTITLVSPSGTPINILNNQFRTGNVPHSSDWWNGLDDTDETGKRTLISEEGDYLVSIQATNPLTGASSTTRGNLRIKY
jgi:flagellar hook assembly protein FlgD